MADPEHRLLPSPRPGVATAERGVVILDVPRGAIVTLTPEAAAAMPTAARSRWRLLAEDGEELRVRQPRGQGVEHAPLKLGAGDVRRFSQVPLLRAAEQPMWVAEITDVPPPQAPQVSIAENR